MHDDTRHDLSQGRDTRHDDIHDALRRGDNDAALRLARANVVAEQDSSVAYRLLAMALRATGDNAAALTSVDRAIAMAPDDADLYFHRAGYLLGSNDVAAAEADLSKTVQLDPNQFGAYVMQAQLALGRGAIDEGERLARLAARVAPDHPWTAVLQGRIALQRGDADAALRLLIPAVEAAPDDAQVRYVLGFAYLKKGHLAFAEQAFRGVIQSSPATVAMWGMIAELLRLQGRPDEAIAALAPLLAAASVTPALRRFAGELCIAAGRPNEAMAHLLAALTAQPGDGRALDGLMHLWQRLGDLPAARATLDTALMQLPENDRLWRARLVAEGDDTDAAFGLITRWLAVQPESSAAREARLGVLIARGDAEAIETAARDLLDRVPGHGVATAQIVEALLLRDPDAAVAYIDTLLPDAGSTQARRVLQSWRGTSLDHAGRRGEAVATWAALQADMAVDALPLPEPTTSRTQWDVVISKDAGTDPDKCADTPASRPAVAFIVGAPGSGVERVAAVLAGTVESFRADRLGPSPPDDGMQSYLAMPQLAAGTIDAAAAAARWRATLPTRGIGGGEIIDWLLWWDNALLPVLREHLPHAILIVALRDPRDMLLEWLAHGAHAPFRFETVDTAALALASALEHVALLHEQAPVAHVLLRTDDIGNNGAALAQALCDALGTPLPSPPAGRFGAPCFAAGRWRDYQDVLRDAFAVLTPVARRLGYVER